MMHCGKDLTMAQLRRMLVSCLCPARFCFAHLAVSWAVPRISLVAVYCCCYSACFSIMSS
jgi:hypothetical protein